MKLLALCIALIHSLCVADTIGLGNGTSADLIRGVLVSTSNPSNGQVLSYNSTTGQWTPATGSSATGTVSSVTGGTGLTGGTITTTGTLAVDVGTGSNQIVQLSSVPQYPAVDGFPITNINVKLNTIKDASATNTMTNTNFKQTWTWNTLSTGVGLELSSTSLTTGSILNVRDTSNQVASAGAAVKVDVTDTIHDNPALELNHANNTGNAMNILEINGTGAAPTQTGVLVTIASQSSSAASYGFKSNMSHTGTNGPNVGAQFTVANAHASSIGAEVKMTSGSQTGVAIKTTHSGSGLNAYLISAGSGTRESVRITGNATAANNNAQRLSFANNRTTGGETVVAAVDGMITDITNGAYKGALIFATANNATPAEKTRIDELGRWFYMNNDAVFLTNNTAAAQTKSFGIQTGNYTGAIVDTQSGSITFTTGTSTTSATVNRSLTGDIVLLTGDALTNQNVDYTPNTGQISITTGGASVANTPSGAINLETGPSAWNSGNISLLTGAGYPGSGDGYSGHINLTNGAPTGTGVRGTIRLDTLGTLFLNTDSEPTCSVDYRGMVRIKQGGAGVADVMRLCLKNAADSYAWVTVTTL